MLIKAAILTERLTIPTAMLVEAYVAGKRVWLAFQGEALHEVGADLAAKQDDMLARFNELAIPNITRDTRTLLDVRLNANRLSDTLFEILPNKIRAAA